MKRAKYPITSILFLYRKVWKMPKICHNPSLSFTCSPLIINNFDRMKEMTEKNTFFSSVCICRQPYRLVTG